MKFSIGAVTLFVAGASAFSPAAGPSSRYDGFNHRKHIIVQRSFLAILLVNEITRFVRASVSCSTQIRQSPVERLLRIDFVVSNSPLNALLSTHHHLSFFLSRLLFGFV